MGQPLEIEFMWLLVSGIMITFLLAVSVVFFGLFYQKRLISQQIILQKMENQYQRDLLAISIQVQEAERKRMAEDLHDEVGALLSTVKLYTSHLKNQQLQGKEPLVDKIIDILDLSIHNLRNISHHILPGNLEKFGLISAVEELCNMIREEGSITVFLDYLEERRLAKEHEFCMYRIVQELLNNTLKHAKATEIQIRMRFDSREFLFNYHDNGQGCDLAIIRETHQKGSGLENLINRARVIGAQMEMDSKPGSGFDAVLNFSLDHHQY